MTLDEIEAGLTEDRDPPITPEEEAWIDRNMGGFDEKYVAALVETKARIDAQAATETATSPKCWRARKRIFSALSAHPPAMIGTDILSANQPVRSTVWFAERLSTSKWIARISTAAQGTSAMTTCPAKYPSPCLCGNQPTHERDALPV